MVTDKAHLPHQIPIPGIELLKRKKEKNAFTVKKKKMFASDSIVNVFKLTMEN